MQLEDLPNGSATQAFTKLRHRLGNAKLVPEAPCLTVEQNLAGQRGAVHPRFSFTPNSQEGFVFLRARNLNTVAGNTSPKLRSS
jgi:hypothetical protein